ncbi:ABC transporter ATP-binding protein [Geodermatophilus sp. URMC 64]
MSQTEQSPMLTVEDVSVEFTARVGRKRVPFRAVNKVGLTVGRGETLAVVGESGSGKSTLARAVLRLLPLAEGRVVVDGVDVTSLKGRALRQARRQAQMVFQDPYSSLDPSSTIANIVGEPLRTHHGLRGAPLTDKVRELLVSVGLHPDYVNRYVHEFSGGQRQRLAIARAIALDPGLVVLDEAVSALDMSTQNQILDLLVDLQARHGMSYLFISHNLAVVRWVADRTAVMYLGRVLEEGPGKRIHDHPAHPYTQSLLSAVPVPDPPTQRTRQRIVLGGETPDPLHVPSGCAFRTRCPYAMEICAVQEPPAVPVEGGGWAACHLLNGAASTPAPEKSLAVG